MRFKILSIAVGVIIFSALHLVSQENSNLPHLQKRGSVTQLIVEGKPFLIFGGELYNSSSSSVAYMKPIWPRLNAMHVNTVLTPVSWELIEPEEGKFDFALVDGLIADARANDLRLVFLWFGSWKNTFSSYAPGWVKRDTKRFPRVLMRDGRPTERLSPFNEASQKSDARAFAALMKHVHQADSMHTVIMVQVENEVGVIPESRDYSPAANAAFQMEVPKSLVNALQSDHVSGELRDAWVTAGRKTKGSWEVVLGKTPITDDYFTAWHYAIYIDAVAAAGKAEHSLPMYSNAALIRPNYKPGQYNSGGPLPHSIDIYRIAAPHLDFVSPDIYFDNFSDWAGKYASAGNPLFVPEARGGTIGAANALYAFGQLNAIGFAPFGIEGNMSLPAKVSSDSARQSITTTYSVLSHLGSMILLKQGTGEMAATVLEGEAQRSARVSLGNYEMAITRASQDAPTDDSANRVSVLAIQTGADEFLVCGSGASLVAFSTVPGISGTAGIESIEEEVLSDGKWQTLRRLNGDENAQGQLLKVNADIDGKPALYKVRLYRY